MQRLKTGSRTPSSLEVAAESMADFLRDILAWKHEECEDGYYSCSKSPGYFGPDRDRGCTCGKDERDEHIANLLARYEAAKK